MQRVIAGPKVYSWAVARRAYLRSRLMKGVQEQNSTSNSVSMALGGLQRSGCDFI